MSRAKIVVGMVCLFVALCMVFLWNTYRTATVEILQTTTTQLRETTKPIVTRIRTVGSINQPSGPVVIPKTAEISTALGVPFTLGKNQTAHIESEQVSLRVTNFIYSPCPEGAQCVWSGLDVEYELTIRGITYNNSYDTPYNVILMHSDYKTYATFIIEKSLPGN